MMEKASPVDHPAMPCQEQLGGRMRMNTPKREVNCIVRKLPMSLLDSNVAGLHQIVCMNGS